MGSSPPPIKTSCFTKFLQSRGCFEVQGTNHRKWKCPGAFRSITFDRGTKEIPFLHVKTNLINIGVTLSEFKAWSKDNC